MGHISLVGEIGADDVQRQPGLSLDHDIRSGLTFDPQPAWEKGRDEIIAKLLPVK